MSEALKQKTRANRKFDFTRFKQRHIALKILYFGWNYHGLADQGQQTETVESHLIESLIKTCLIECKQKCNFSRCGRTDKGVSSYAQVVNLTVRSALIDESTNQGLFTPQDYNHSSNPNINKSNLKELNYCDMINHNLPDMIKVIAWAPIDQDFSARFNCQNRAYSYIFPKGDLNIESMQEGLNFIIGQHDFRNLCSLDLKNGVTNHVRTILKATVTPIDHEISGRREEYEFYNIIIVGQAFLYHQIRCIMTVMFLIGSRKEKPTVIKDLLDLNKCPCKPLYPPASPLPLCLFECNYSDKDFPQGWNYDIDSLSNVIKKLKNLWWEHKTKTIMIERALFDVQGIFDDLESQNGQVQNSDLSKWKNFSIPSDNMSDNKYLPLLSRAHDEPLDIKIEEMKKKKIKIDEIGPPV